MSGKGNVLIVDDDESIRLILAEVLSGDGYNVAQARTGEEALKNLKQKDFDVVLTDLMMPVTDGMELLTIIKKLKPQTRVVMLTAFATIESAVEAMKKGASDYISKPFDALEVRNVVRDAMGESKFGDLLKKPLTIKKGGLRLQPMIKTLSSPIRRKVVDLLNSKERSSFMQIVDGIGIDDHTKLSFHLRNLKTRGIITQDEDKRYFLTEKGEYVAEILKSLEERAEG